MSLKTKLQDGRGTRNAAKVYPDGELATLKSPLPPFGGASKMRVFRQFLTTDGTASGTKDMRTNGSSTNVDFYIPASETKDRYICMLSVALVDANATLDKFGNLSALANGCRLFYSDEEGEVNIHDAIKTNFQFVRLGTMSAPLGSDAAAFRLKNAVGTSEAYLPVLDLRQMFGFEWGLRLAVGTEQRLTMTIRDNLSTGLDQFDCVSYGFERAE